MQQPNEERFRHRDLNWLSFNERVLQEAEDHLNPLFERMKFLAIFFLPILMSISGFECRNFGK